MQAGIIVVAVIAKIHDVESLPARRRTSGQAVEIQPDIVHMLENGIAEMHVDPPPGQRGHVAHEDHTAQGQRYRLPACKCLQRFAQPRQQQ